MHVTLRLAPDGGTAPLAYRLASYCLRWGSCQLGLRDFVLFGIHPALPMHLLSTLRTLRYRNARKTRYRPACSALTGPDFHWQAAIG
jgi:hypothetical protein